MPHSPRGWLIVALAAIIVVVAGFGGVYFTMFNGSSAAPLTLSSGSATGGQLAVASAAGAWSLAPSSVVGYRVREKLAFLPAKSDAVGMTSDVAGSLSAVRGGNGLTVTAARFLANVRTLKSDRSQRDAQIHRIGLQSDRYPTAGFRLTRPISLPASALNGQEFHSTATGLLTIHGTTRTVSIPITGRVKGTQIETVGSITFPFTEFGMQAPSIGGFVSVENHATLEFDLRFQHGASARTTTAFRTIAAIKPSTSSAGAFGPGPAGAPNPSSKQFAAFTQCLSRHGVKAPAGPGAGAPPGAGGPPPSGSKPPAGNAPGPGAQNPKMAAAMKACSSLQPKLDPGQGSSSGSTP
jgi:polyisoprenoid-binding protein YceI